VLASIPLVGPLVVVIETNDYSSKQILVWGAQGIQTWFSYCKRLSKVVQEVFTILKIKAGPETILLQVNPTNEISEKLVELEQKLFVSQFKFGVLLARDTEGKGAEVPFEEGELYNTHELTPDFTEFLDCIATKTSTATPDIYTGGLQPIDGEYFYATTYQQNSIALHVAPLIRSKEDDPSRKRHIGNDIVVIIFKESQRPIDPSVFLSKFNHIFVVVTKVPTEPETTYRVEIASKSSVPYFPPRLFLGNTFKKSEFRPFFLTKLLNGERSALSRASAFTHSLRRTTLAYLTHLFATYGLPAFGYK